MQAGKLREYVTLQEKSVTRDAFGGEVVTWTTVESVYAELDPWQMRQRLTLRRQQGDAVIGLRVRWPSQATMAKRYLVDGTGYHIIEIDPSRKHKGELLVTCQAEDTAP
jgi:SPP1 family predicted phage head-tail adaptor